jgi:aspartyl-tRNA(Asn)/glutamyl-tRNA(Gln) amidotransferase subunit C
VSSLTASDVRRSAALARLDLDESEVERFATELAAILDYAAQVQSVDTTGAAADDGAFAGEPRMRADAAAPSLPREAVLEQAPGADAAAGFFTVPRVLGA